MHARPSRTRRAAAAAARPPRPRRRRRPSVKPARSARAPGAAIVRAPSGAVSVPAPGSASRRASRTSAGLFEQVLGIAAQPVGRVAGRDARRAPRSRARARHDRLPADAAREGLVAQLDRPGVVTGAVSGSSTRVVRRPPWPGRVRDRRPARAAAARPADRRRSARAARRTSACLRASSAASGHVPLLERRDLGLVEDVAHVDPVRRHAAPARDGSRRSCRAGAPTRRPARASAARHTASRPATRIGGFTHVRAPSESQFQPLMRSPRAGGSKTSRDRIATTATVATAAIRWAR